MHRDRQIRIRLDRRLNQVFEERFTCILTRTRRSLHDDRRIDLVRSLHDRLYLLEIVHIERRHAVAIFRSVVEQLTQ